MFDKFNYDILRKNDNYKKIDDKTIRFLTVLTIIFIGLITFYGINKLVNNKHITFKEDNSKNVVYTKYQSNKAHQYIPYLNTKNKDLQKINDNIYSYTKEYIDNPKVKIKYNYDLNGIILSLVIKIFDEENYIVKFRSYNINIEEESLLDDKYLINYYSLDESEINKKVRQQLYKYYQDELGKFLVEQEVDFDRYLRLRTMEEISINDYAFYIKEGYLVAYVPFNPYTIYNEQKYFTEKSFMFKLKKAPAE